MSVVEQHSFAIGDPEEGLLAASRLAEAAAASLRWAAVWTAGAGRPDLESLFATRAAPVVCETAYGVSVLCVSAPKMDEVHHLMENAGPGSLCVHWSVPLYEADDGEEAPWISFVDSRGHKREDARVYRIELAFNAVPLSSADRPWQDDFVLGPEVASGWALRLTAVRDHMPKQRLRAHLSEVAAVPALSSPP